MGVAMAESNKAHWAWWAALRDAWLQRDTAHFPQREPAAPATPTHVSDTEIISAMNTALEHLSAGGDTPEDKAALEALVERSRESLDEVKAQTEYQDQKSVRLLTVATFFVALSGVLINGFGKNHSVRIVWGGAIDGWQLLSVPVYLGFALFALSVVVGALVTFHATQTRFRYERETAIKPGAPMSQIFFRGIARADPTEWARSFTQDSGNSTIPANDLTLRYAKNYILESYLVAAKVADKMRYLEAAQAILAFSLKVLLIWLPILAIVLIIHPGDPKQDQPLSVEVTAIRSLPTAPTPTASIAPTAPAAITTTTTTKASHDKQ